MFLKNEKMKNYMKKGKVYMKYNPDIELLSTYLQLRNTVRFKDKQIYS